MVRRDSLDQAAAQLARDSLRAIARDGVSRATLETIGGSLASLAGRIPGAATTRLRDAQCPERELWREPDGTFEFVVTLLPAASKQPEAVSYETWIVIAPVDGSVRVSVPGEAAAVIRPGESRGFAQGEAMAMDALEHGAVVLRLYGIAREHLPPPRSVRP